jgi:phenylacetate-CoA ligase
MSYGSRLTKTLYYSLPRTVKNLFSTVYGFQQRRERYGKDFEKTLSFLEESQYWNNERLKQYQNKCAGAFIVEAAQKVQYYSGQKSFAEYLKGQDIRTLPILSKDQVRENLTGLYARDLSKIPHRWAHTSGTTGKSLVFPLSKYCFQREYAFRSMHYQWGGVSMQGRDRVATCAGHPVALSDRKMPPFWVYDWSNNWLFFSSYHLSEKNLPAYISELEKFDPVMLHGYPSSVYLLALAFEKYGGKKLNLRSIYVSSETLLGFQRKRIEEAFGVKVYNWYGNSEMCANIVECERGELHLKLEHSLVEILNENDQECQPGQTGRLVCTGFGNSAFPLIRYEIGDSVTIASDQRAKCGRSGQLIEQVNGREEDYVITRDGRFVGRLDHIFKDSRNVIEAQLFQKSVDELIIRIKKKDVYSTKDELAITKEARLRLGKNIEIKFEYVDHISRTANGKFRFMLSYVDQSKILSQMRDG